MFFATQTPLIGGTCDTTGAAATFQRAILIKAASHNVRNLPTCAKLQDDLMHRTAVIKASSLWRQMKGLRQRRSGRRREHGRSRRRGGRTARPRESSGFAVNQRRTSTFKAASRSLTLLFAFLTWPHCQIQSQSLDTCSRVINCDVLAPPPPTAPPAPASSRAAAASFQQTLCCSGRVRRSVLMRECSGASRLPVPPSRTAVPTAPTPVPPAPLMEAARQKTLSQEKVLCS